MVQRVGIGVLILVCAMVGDLCSAQEQIRTEFVVKHVSADSVYLEGGSNAGLAEGQKLTIRRKGAQDAPAAQIQIESVTPLSSAGRILPGDGDVAPGDIAFLPPEEVEKLKQRLASTDAGSYPQIISFTTDDPLDQEVRENLPKPPSPEVNRIRGRVSFDFGHLKQREDNTSSLYGLTLRIDASRLGGSHWNLNGYYRGYRHSRQGSSIEPMLVDLVNRTYHLSLTYDNPTSHWVAGVGRLFVPWASSLDTLDGFYLGRRHGKATFGIFGGSAPDPTSWDYDLERKMAGGFVNFEGGSFDSWRFTSTSGIAVTRTDWRPDRQFGFFQNGIFFKRYFAVYSDLQCDLLHAFPVAPDSARSPAERGLALSRSYVTVRIQPLRALSFDISENYFRNIPTFDERLLSTGLVDKYLFQGLSGGFQLELPHKLGIYSTVGRSNRSGDAKPSWDYLAGVTAADILGAGVRADLKYSRFSSSFGQGTYQSVTLGRDVGAGLQFDMQIGQQDFLSALASRKRSRFFNGNLNWILGTRYYLGVGFTIYRGDNENYRQSFATIGYRFDNRRLRHE